MLLKIVIVLFLLFVYKFIVKPLFYILRYLKNSGFHRFTFIPIVGPFGALDKDLKQFGDSFHNTKKTYEIFPNARAVIFNIADRAALTILDQQLIKDYFVNKEDNYVKYELTYKNKARIFGNGVAFAEGEEWKRRRVVTTALMNYDFFQIILPKLQQTASKVISELNFEKGTVQFNALEFSSRIAGETIVKSFFGTDLHDMKFRGEPIALAMSKFVTEISAVQKQLIVFLFGANVLQYGLTNKHKLINQKIQEIRAFGKQIVNSKINSSETDTQMNFVKYIKEKGYLDSNKPIHLTSTQLLEEFFTFFVGGMDTTAHLLHMALYYLAIHPEIQQKLRNEIKDTEEAPSISTINKLKYLDNFINETNRHYGFMNSFFPREAVNDHMLGDVKIYKGTLVMLGWLSNYYNSEFFPEPYEFNPDRWNQPLEHPYSFTPFSAGKRTCIGKNIALIEIKLVLINLLKAHKLTGDPNYKLRLTFRSLYEPETPIVLSATKLDA